MKRFPIILLLTVVMTAFYSCMNNYDPEAEVLIHWFNDRSKTANNLKPHYTSTVDVKYVGRLYNDVPFDSSFLSTSPADSLFRCKFSSMIDGWGIAIPQMRVGDSCRVVIPYNLAYGTTSRGNVILPFSTLVFDIKLVDIYAYETSSN